MRPAIYRFTCLCAVVLLLAGSLAAQGRGISTRHRGDSGIRISGDSATDCNQIEMTSPDGHVFRGEEKLTVPATSAAVRFVSPARGAVVINGWEGGHFAVTACKGVVGDSTSRGQDLLSRLSLVNRNGVITVDSAGQAGDWTVYLLIQAPRNASTDVETRNGPLSIYGVNGMMKASATNGPISVRDCTGQIRVSAHNGPVSFTGAEGQVELNTQNGPISISVGDSWRNGGLKAMAENGPITLQIPDSFGSGVQIVTARHTPFTCRATACNPATRSEDDDRIRLQFGGSPPAIRVETVNGPISVRSSRNTAEVRTDVRSSIRYLPH